MKNRTVVGRVGWGAGVDLVVNMTESLRGTLKQRKTTQLSTFSWWAVYLVTLQVNLSLRVPKCTSDLH